MYLYIYTHKTSVCVWITAGGGVVWRGELEAGRALGERERCGVGAAGKEGSWGLGLGMQLERAEVQRRAR